MENQNQNQNVVPMSTPTPITPAPGLVQKPQDKIIKKINDLKIKFDNASKNTKILTIVVGSLFGLIFLLLILVLLFAPKNNHLPVLIPSPTPISVTPAPNIVLNASRYATDAGVLKIESDLNTLQSQLESTDVKQSDLNQPNINFDITFNK